MSEIIRCDTAVRALVKFAGTYGIKEVIIRSTMTQRFSSTADLVLVSSNDDVIPVELKNVQYPNNVVRGVAMMMRVSYNVRYQFALESV